MLKNKVSLVALLGLAVLTTTLTGCGRKGLIKVNGEKISKDEFIARLEQVPVQTQQGTQLAGQYVVQQMIQEKLVQQLAKKEGVTPTETQINKKLETIKKQSGGDFNRALAGRGMTIEDFKKQMTTEQCLINVVTKGVNIPDPQVKAAYDQALAAKNSPFKRPEQVMVSMILTKDKAGIDKAYGLLNRGGLFEQVVKEQSQDPVTKPNQGQVPLPITKADTRVPAEMRTMAFSLAVGKFSQPFNVKGSWVILKANQKKPAKTQTYGEVKDFIKEQLAMREGAKKNNFNKDLADFAKTAEITVNAERYKGIPDLIKKQAAQNQPLPGATTGNTSPVAPK